MAKLKHIHLEVAAAVFLLCVICGCGRATDTVDHFKTPAAVTTAPAIGSHAPITVEARGTDFKWQFLTTGPDRKIGTGDETVLGNELVVPPQTVVTLILTSTDYVYTLNVPDGRIAAAVPDMIHQIQFQSPDSGRHEFRMDPMCGLRYFHDEVLGTMSVAENGDFGSLQAAR